MTAKSGMLLGSISEMDNMNGDSGEKTVSWYISNYKLCRHSTVYQSQPFTFANISWCIQMCPPKTLDDVLEVGLKNITRADCKTILLSFGTFRGTHKETRVSRTSFEEGRTYPFLTGHFLHDQRLGYLNPGTFIISCDLEFVPPGGAKDLKRKHVHTSEHMNVAGLESLSKNLRDFLANKEGCDAVLLVQGKEFKAHRSILSARSSVFAAMFRHDTAERRTGQVTIADCDPNYFQEFLEYLYCGRLEASSSDNAFHLYKTADKYNVQELKALCVNYLMGNLTVENIYDVFTFADEYNEINLLSLAQEIFNENLEKILKSSEWENLFRNNFPLATRLLTEMAKTKK